MKIFKNLKIEKKYRNSVIAIGNFDGVHKGHNKVFTQAKRFAKENNTSFGILTFRPLPVMFFNKKVINYRLISENKKLKLFEKHGAHFVLNINFNRAFSKITAENFIKNIIYKKVNPKMIFVSNNFKFGYKRKGNVSLLKKFEKGWNYKLIKIKPYKYKGKIISSTRIRKCLRRGDLILANKLLSRTWFIEGDVRKGKKLGRKLGYRTCNIRIINYILPKLGVYAVKISMDDKKKLFKGIAYIGSRPTFSGKEVLLEINIFGIKKNLYRKKLRVYFLKFLRRDKKFKNSAKLIEQMNKDLILVKKGLKTKLVL